MSLPHALLASLIQAPKSGYDLAKQFDGSVGFFWQATHQQIYRELTKLEQQEEIAAELIAQAGKPDKKIFSVTELGLAQLKTWVLEASDVAPSKDEFLVKIFAGYLVPQADIVQKIQRHRQLHVRQLATYEAIEKNFFAKLEQCDRKARFAYLTLRCGIHFEQGWIDWCDEVLGLLGTWE
jgi:DNA-binding PadR family transcriptional regulator